MNIRDVVYEIGNPAGRRGIVVDFDRKGIWVVRWQNGLTTHHHSGELTVVGHLDPANIQHMRTIYGK